MGAEDGKSHRVQIYIAVIGVVGILGGALIGNWDKVFPPTTTPSPLSTETTPPTSPPPQAACVIKLAMPPNRAVLPQRRGSNERIEINVLFSWSTCPEATRYHLVINGPGGSNPIVSEEAIVSADYQYMDSAYTILQPKGWTWKVRAFIDDRWGTWSEERTFDFAPPP